MEKVWEESRKIERETVYIRSEALRDSTLLHKVRMCIHVWAFALNHIHNLYWLYVNIGSQ